MCCKGHIKTTRSSSISRGERGLSWISDPGSVMKFRVLIKELKSERSDIFAEVQRLNNKDRERDSAWLETVHSTPGKVKTRICVCINHFQKSVSQLKTEVPTSKVLLTWWQLSQRNLGRCETFTPTVEQANLRSF